MWTLRTRARRSRAFRPTVGGQLEARRLLSDAAAPALLAHAAAVRNQAPVRQAATASRPRFVHWTVANGGSTARIFDYDGEVWNVIAYEPANLPSVTGGAVRARPRPDGTVDLIVQGSTPDTVLEINPAQPTPAQGSAHTYPHGIGRQDGLLHVNSIIVQSGKINQILGYRTADLRGQIRITGTDPISRIALYQILPGASIEVAGDLSTLETYQGLSLSRGGRIRVGRDLNLLTVGRNLIISPGSELFVRRYLGLVPQPARGSGLGSDAASFAGISQVGAYVQGNILVRPGGRLVAARGIGRPLFTKGVADGTSRIFSPAGTVAPASAVVALGGKRA